MAAAITQNARDQTRGVSLLRQRCRELAERCREEGADISAKEGRLGGVQAAAATVVLARTIASVRGAS